MKKNDYDKQAERFLKKHGVEFTCKRGATDKAPNWVKDGEEHGYHYRVTLSKGKPCTPKYTGNICAASRISFDFWDSIANRREGVTIVRPYSVLSCISGDVYTPDTFEAFCSEFGYDTDSVRAAATFKRCDKFAKRLRAFLTEAEIADLSEIN